MNKDNRLTVGVLLALALVVWGYLFWNSRSNSTPKTSQPATQQQETQPKKDTSELNAEVKYDEVAILVTNNEDKDWKGCSLKVNGDYELTNVDLPAKQSTSLLYSSFTKADGTKFNTTTTAFKNLYIGSCTDENSSRYAYFGVN